MMKLLAILLVFSLWSQPLSAARESFDAFFAEPAAEFGLPEGLLAAIARVESGLNPWAINIAGRGYQCISREEALARAQAAQAAGRSFDLGIMQINSWWLDKTGLSPEAILDPQANIRFGGWILKQEFERFGNVREAVGAYHSPWPHRAGPYADLVLAVLNQKNRKAAFVPAALKTPQQSRKIRVSETTIANSMKVRKKTYEGYK